MKLGIVGLPNVGKSTLFNTLTKAGAESANYPFCTIDPNIGVVSVLDERLDILSDMYKTQKTIPAVIEFVDIAGLVKGASKGEGLGNQFLSHIREVDAIVHVVRCFKDSNIVHVDGSINPLRDIETINLELIFSDMEIITRRITKIQKAAQSDKVLKAELEILQKLDKHLEEGICARNIELLGEEQIYVSSLNLLTSKPVLYACNVTEDDLVSGAESNKLVADVKEYAEKESSETFIICAKIEEEIAELDDDEKKIFLDDLGISDTGFERLVVAGYKLLGLISYLTAGEKEVRAWTITKGTKAPQAAGKIHTDFEKGFIRAEVVAYEDLVKAGSQIAAKEKGLVRLEGKEYVVQDGDVILFRFNV